MKSLKDLFKKKENDVEVVSGDLASAKVVTKQVWKRFIYLFKVANIPYMTFILYVLLSVLQTTIIVKVPEVNANFFTGDASVESILMFFGCEILITVVCQIVLYVNHVFRLKTNRNLRNVLWGKILKLKASYYDRVSPNTLLSRITVDTEAFNTFLLDVLWSIVNSIYLLGLTIKEMSDISLKASFYLLVFVPFSIFLSFVIGRMNLKFQNSERHTMSNLTDYLSELVSSLPIVKSFNKQHYETKRGEKVIDEYYISRKNLILLDVGKQFVGSIVGSLPTIAILLIGVKMLTENSMDAAGWYIFYIYSGTLYSFASELGRYWEMTKAVQGQLETVSQVLLEKEEGLDHYVNEIIESGDISYDNVSFAYNDVNVINKVSFTIHKNKTNAIVGYSGSGKSTLLKFLVRLYEPTEGRILLNGKNLNDYNLKEWRRKIAFVQQDSPIISGTIRENVLYGIERVVSNQEIMEAAKLAYVDEFIEKCPNGLDYEVGQFGSKLSGGQRQKLAIVRAILSKPEYLILDEPTASLDILSTNEIVSTIHKLHGEMTIVIVAHHAQLIQDADNIVILSKNQAVVEGSHEDLISNQYYQKLMNEEMEVEFNEK